MRFLTVLFFAFYVNYIPVHLATATHLNDAVAALLHSVWHSHDHSASPSNEPDHHQHHHSPHPATDHALVLHLKNQSTAVVVQIVFFQIEDLSLPAPEVKRGGTIIERIKPPGESPPDPAQPRAPPIA